MLPLHVFLNGNFSLAMAMTFLTGLAMFGAMTFLPLFQQTVRGESPTVSGLALTPMMLGVTVTSIVAGQVTRRPAGTRCSPSSAAASWPWACTCYPAWTRHHPAHLGAVLRSPRPRHGLPHADGLADRAEQRAAAGHGRGQQRPDVLPADRRVTGRGRVRRRLRPAADQSLAAAAGPGAHISASGGQLDPATVNTLPAPVRHDVFVAIADAVQHVFIWALPSAVLIFVLAWFIKEVPLAAGPPRQRPRASSRSWWADGAASQAARTGRGGSHHGPFGDKSRPQAPTYGTASRISTVLARPFGSE